ncbi:MAG TPA: hydroxymethylbilane synthase [Verrucomicrobiae bacterium]|jgi:hydroxymethylbilane synthase|nr:hydroxymethylbilane synthase [Verrucomicrobiae bacterium]
MSLFLSLRLAGRRALVVGGGTVALRKTRSLLEAGADVRVIAPSILPDLLELLRQHGGVGDERSFARGDAADAFVVVVATGDDEINALVVAEARYAGAIVVDSTDPERGDATMLALARLGDVTVAVDSGGSTPAFAKRIAHDVRERLGDAYGRAARVLAHARTYVKAVLPIGERAAVLRALADLPIETLGAMNPVEIEHEAEAAIDRLRGKEEAPTPRTAVCASRSSALALTQTRMVAALLAQRGIATTILPVSTTGDRVQDRPLAEIGEQSLFVKELERALQTGRADYAVHSCKDLPTATPADMSIAAISQREDPRDVFCSERYPTFASLPAGATVGTSSLRRRAQLAAMRPDLHYADLRGNVDTRLRKLRDGDYDAIVLAAAGLARLNLRAEHTVAFSLDEMVPAVAQGALAIETRADDAALIAELRAAVNDQATQWAVVCERTALAALQGGCQAPIGIHAGLQDGRTIVRGVVATPDGSKVVRALIGGDVDSLESARALGLALAENLLAQGAGTIVEALARPRALPLAGRTVVLPRTQSRPSRIAAALRQSGATVLELRADTPLPGDLPDLLIFPSSGAVAVAGPYLVELALRGHYPPIGVMGPQTREAAEIAGLTVLLEAPEPSVELLVGLVSSFLEGSGP